jgi:hypothetical protein
MKKSRAWWVVHRLENENAFRDLVQIPVGKRQKDLDVCEMIILKWI